MTDHLMGSGLAKNNNALTWLKEPKRIPLTLLKSTLLDTYGVELWVARLDLVDPLISGNKWFKLKYNLIQALEQGASHVVSFGGAYSNHLHALAAACHRLGLKSTAVLRGELVSPFNPTLKDCDSWGMSFLPITRAQYREKATPQFLQSLRDQLGDFYLVPEGGSNVLAAKGMSEVAKTILDQVESCDYLCCAVGSGGTLSGLVAGGRASVTCVGYSALKGGQYIESDITSLVNHYRLGGGSDANDVTNSAFDLVHDYHFGGFAKVKPELMSFIEWFERSFEIPLEQVYTAKLFFGIFDQIKSGYYKKGQRIVALHTGGLQGRRSIASL